MGSFWELLLESCCRGIVGELLLGSCCWRAAVGELLLIVGQQPIFVSALGELLLESCAVGEVLLGSETAKKSMEKISNRVDPRKENAR